MMSRLEKLEKVMDEAKVRMSEWTEFFARLETQLHELKTKAVSDEEWPKGDSSYHTLLSDNRVVHCLWTDDPYDQFRLAAGNVHRTKEEAEAYREWLTSPRTQARRRVEICEGHNITGSYAIIDTAGGLDIYDDCILEGGLRFNTVAQARACIDLLGEDVIKCALGVTS